MSLTTTTTLTDVELLALGKRGNLADGHAYQGLESMLPTVATELEEIWATSETRSSQELEARFRASYALLAGAPAMHVAAGCFTSPTASNSIDIVAAVLSSRGARTGLVEPTFDNLALLMRRRGVDLTSVPESLVRDAVGSEASVVALLNRAQLDALVLVQPNNPTGHELAKDEFIALAAGCASTQTLLVLDRTFRLYASDSFDDLSILQAFQTPYVVIEDTGKVWPTNDLKVSLILTSAHVLEDVRTIHAELYLCQSKFALELLTRCVDETIVLGVHKAIRTPVLERRLFLRTTLRDTPLQVPPQSIDSLLPVEWIQCQDTGLSDLAFADRMADSGVTVLPGRYFYWDSESAPSSQLNIRIAMLKPISDFRWAIGRLCEQMARTQ